MTTCGDFFYSAEHKRRCFEECWTLKKIFREMSKFKLYTEIQDLHTQNAKCLASLAKWSTAFKISQTRLKRKHLSYIANTFAIILHFWIYHIHTLIKNLKVFSHEQRDVWKIHGIHESKIETKLFTVSICGFEDSITQYEKKMTSSMCSYVDVYL